MRIIVYIFLFSITFKGSIAQGWTAEELAAANTAVEVGQLNAQEKEVILYVNLARMYPRKFAELEVKNYLGPGGNWQYLKTSEYKVSLLAHLRRMKPVAPVYFDASMYALAKCFAREMGERGYAGHHRRDCTDGFYGECCSYGHDKGKDITLQLLIDHNVPSLGHREICLSESYKGIGVSIAPHKKYEFGAVLDFR
jgi:uncharacterized protein YkwD